TMISTYTHGSSIFFTNFNQRSKTVFNSFYLGFIFMVGVFNECEFFLINIITGINSYFFYYSGCYLGSIWSKMNICNYWCIITSFPKFIFNFQKVLSFLFTRGSNSYEFCTC